MSKAYKEIEDIHYGATRALGESLRTGLKLAGITQKECADELGVTVSALQPVMDGQTLKVSEALVTQVLGYLGFEARIK